MIGQGGSWEEAAGSPVMEGPANGTCGPSVPESRRENQVEGLPLAFGPQLLGGQTRKSDRKFTSKGFPSLLRGESGDLGSSWPGVALEAFWQCGVEAAWSGEVLGRYQPGAHRETLAIPVTLTETI